MSIRFLRALRVLSVFLLVEAVFVVRGQDQEPFGLDKRVRWTTSRVAGSPEPPLPFTTEKLFPQLEIKNPLFLAAEPGTDLLLLVLQGGEANRPTRILRIQNEAGTSEGTPFLEIAKRVVYSVEFDPGYLSNGWVYVFSNGPTPEPERTNRISRFTVHRQAPYRCDPASEKVIIEWHSQGHDGGGMAFGQDGMFYVSTGDGTSDSDGWNSGQTVDDLLGSILRIDLRQSAGTNNYSVPADNPFVSVKGARPEIWAYGLRNPWRITIDRKTGHLWAGNNGQDLWETAHFVRKGENYGWSVYEGNHPFYLNRKRGPTPFVPPTIEHHHSEMRSLTGGIVYYGAEFPELSGAYLYGDHSSGQIWGARHDGTRLTWWQKLAQTTHQIAAFCADQRGRVLIVDYGGGIHRLTRAPERPSTTEFPRRLSQTGIFASVREHKIAPGIIPYSVNAPGWNDGAHVERFLGIPNDDQIEHTKSGGWNLSDGAVLLQTLSLEMKPGDSSSRRRVESRLLTRQSGQWAGYSYRWSEDESDATLVAAGGDNLGTVGGVSWRFPSRNECMACHSRAANFVLGLSDAQMDRSHDYGAANDNQIKTFERIGLFRSSPKRDGSDSVKLVNPYDATASLEARARSYLHVNCSVCHIEAGGGNSKMELAIGRRLDRMNLVEARPQHDTFGIANAMLVFPGKPENSVLFQRITRRGRGQMPPLVSNRVDEKAIALFGEWIRSLNSEQQFVKEWSMDDLLPVLDQLKAGRSFESGKTAFEKTGCAQCHRFAGSGGVVGPDLEAVGQRLNPAALLESILLPSKNISEGYASTEIETDADESFTGFIESENTESITIRPLAGNEPARTLAKKQITRRTLSGLSNMPAGVVNSLTHAQVLDLLAYLISNGDSSDARFSRSEN